MDNALSEKIDACTHVCNAINFIFVYCMNITSKFRKKTRKDHWRKNTLVYTICINLEKWVITSGDPVTQLQSTLKKYIHCSETQKYCNVHVDWLIILQAPCFQMFRRKCHKIVIVSTIKKGKAMSWVSFLHRNQNQKYMHIKHMHKYRYKSLHDLENTSNPVT